MKNIRIDDVPQISIKGTQPYVIDVADSVLADLYGRLENT
jgi:hypothetical protein